MWAEKVQENLRKNIDLQGANVMIENRKIKVRFFTQLPSVWPSTESVWKAFNENEKCDTKIVQLPFIHDSYKDSKGIDKYLIQRNISYIMYDKYDIYEDKPDVVFFQNPYDSTRPKEFSFENISKVTDKIVYIPYALDIGGGKESIKWQFKLNVQRKAWRVIARSDNYKEFYLKFCDNNPLNIVVLGHPKFDYIYNMLKSEFQISKGWIEKIGGRKVIMWNPHFSVDGGYWSTFLIWKDFIFNVFNKRNDLVLLMRPHPLLFERLKKLDKYNDVDIENLRKFISNSDNIILDETDNYKDAFKISDALITDAGSFMIEYLPIKKPIMYLPNENGVGIYDNRLLKNYYIGKKEEDILNFINMISNDEDKLFDIRTKNMINEIPFFDGKIGNRIMEYIISQL